MLSLLFLLPSFLLFISALGIVVLRQFRPSVGYAWIWASTAAILSLGLMVFLRWRLPMEWVAGQWQPFSSATSLPVFRLNEVSWPYALSLSALVLAVFWSDSARLEGDAGPKNWILSLATAALGLIAVMAGSPLTLILAWTAVDLLELVVILGTTAGRQFGEENIIAFSVRVSGTLLVLAAILYSTAQGIPFTFDPIPPELAIFMLLAVGLRLGVLPLNLPYVSEVYVWRGFGNLLRLISPASSLVILGSMPATAVPESWRSPLLVLTALAALYGGAMWLGANPNHNGRPYWVISLAALAVASVVSGAPKASIAWGVALLLSGSVIFLFSAQRKQIMFIPLVGLLGLVGLPLTPTVGGWVGLIRQPLDGFSILFMLAVLLLLWGYLRRAFVPHDELYRMERWVHTVYPAGLLLLVISQWFIALMTWRESLMPPGWWAPLIVVLVGLAVGALVYARRADLTFESLRARWVMVFARRAGNFLAELFRLNWLYRTLGWIYAGVQWFVQLLTAIFEGDGGVLWALVMLAVLISVLTSGGAP